MNFLTDSFFSALLLIWTLDHNLIEIIGVSLKVGSISTFISALVGVPSGFLIAFSDFKGKRLVITILNTLL
ncbi:MAG: ABC transporter permease, partial [Desulfobacteraceae bacterium]|nr:ABC transporter permease [Desulfobacteraceae bacterium]